MTQQTKNLVPALVKAEKVLTYIAERKQVNFTQIYKDLEIAKSSAHSLLATLEHFQFIRQTTSGEYCLGLKLYQLGSAAVNNINLRDEARPIVKELASEVQLTTHLGILYGIEGTYLIKEEIDHILKITSWEGKSIRLLSSAIGKALIAWQPHSLVDEVLGTYEMVPHTETTITTIPAMLKELATIRKTGWAIDNEEDGYGVRCLASVVRGAENNIIGAVSVCGTLHQVPMERLDTLAETVTTYCHKISTKMGYRN